jgi:hypothetical protein
MFVVLVVFVVFVALVVLVVFRSLMPTSANDLL